MANYNTQEVDNSWIKIMKTILISAKEVITKISTIEMWNSTSVLYGQSLLGQAV